jgi:hypothetical protein
VAGSRRAGLAPTPRALELLEAASHFEPSYVGLVAALTGSAAERHPTWTTMLREVMIAGAPGTHE